MKLRQRIAMLLLSIYVLSMGGMLWTALFCGCHSMFYSLNREHCHNQQVADGQGSYYTIHQCLGGDEVGGCEDCSGCEHCGHCGGCKGCNDKHQFKVLLSSLESLQGKSLDLRSISVDLHHIADIDLVENLDEEQAHPVFADFAPPSIIDQIYTAAGFRAPPFLA